MMESCEVKELLRSARNLDSQKMEGGGYTLAPSYNYSRCMLEQKANYWETGLPALLLQDVDTGIISAEVAASRSLKSGTTATMVGGPKGFGGTKGMFTVFLLRIFGRLFWSSQNLYSVPSNSVYGPPKIIVLSPQIPFIVPQKSLFCPLLITIHCSPQNHCYVPSNSTYPA